MALTIDNIRGLKDRILEDIESCNLQIQKPELYFKDILQYFNANAEVFDPYKKITAIKVYTCIKSGIQTGLSFAPFKSELYIDARKSKSGDGTANLIIMKKGKEKLALREGILIRTAIIYSNEEFLHEDYGYKIEFHHIKKLVDKGEPVGAYATATDTNKKELIFVEMMDKEQINSCKPRTITSFSPWTKQPLEMWRKTALNRMFKALPIQNEIAIQALRNEVEASIEQSSERPLEIRHQEAQDNDNLIENMLEQHNTHEEAQDSENPRSPENPDTEEAIKKPASNEELF